MPRNSGGVYSLYTPGNPVVPATVISTTWANNTLTDLATAMTDSLSRSGSGAMLAALQLVDGSLASPGLTWSTETSSGWLREGTNQFAFSVSGSKRLGVTTGNFISQVAGDANLQAVNTLASITALLQTDSTNSRVLAGASTNHGLALITNNTSRLAITNAGAVTIPGTLDVTGTLTGTTISASTALNVAGTSVRDATNLFTSGTVPAARLPSSFSGLANPSATIGLTAVNGAASTAMRSDGAPALSQAITPTWTQVHTFAATPLITGAGGATLQFQDSTAASNAKLYSFSTSAGGFEMQTRTDANGPGQVVFAVARSGTTVTSFNHSSGTLQYGGLEVGFRLLAPRSVTNTDSTAAGDSGQGILFTGANTFTFTGDTDVPTNGIVTLANAKSGGTLSIAASGTLSWLSGSGTISTGTRTLAVAGVATLWHQGSGNYYIWGTGVS